MKNNTLFSSFLNNGKEEQESSKNFELPDFLKTSVDTISELKSLPPLLYPRGFEIEVKEDNSKYVMVHPFLNKWEKKEASKKEG